ncbi:NADP-dependent phosphogluconate dehydrogenase [Vibrio atypicus]|uniref:NADP-dependent phosphogluconate dehydrogenase n=1 Tax=Vibrio atypicus TaxID=558271 RepID=UPI001356E29D|nr:NADP-dependent phosphogluconate dehydrogenase [Vibrio atypicus]
MSNSDIAMIGLGVMGKSLALNLIDQGFDVVGFDISDAHRIRAENEAKNITKSEGKGAFSSVDSIANVLLSLKSPRVVALSLPAGHIIESVVDDLLNAGLNSDDIVIDTGNSLWTDSESREAKYRDKLRFFSTAVSGGEVGARIGPALMASGDKQAWQYVQPMWEAIAAKVDDKGLPVGQFEQGEPCAAYLGPAGAGHYVKMVHNGIEYADMQLICEAYHFMTHTLDLPADAVGKVFESWNQGVLNSYLMEISADILQTSDPVTGQPFVDVVLDQAGQKGTGLWTAINSLQQGAPAPTIAQSVFARAQSAQKATRIQASEILKAQTKFNKKEEVSQILANLHDALYCSKLVVYAQGFDLMAATSIQEKWQLDFSKIAKIWRSGCIIRAGFLQDISFAYQTEPDLPNLLLNRHFSHQLKARTLGWRETVSSSAMSGVPMPGISSALSYFDSLRCAVLPANLLQAQRDYFGSHTYSRVDKPEEQKFHLSWSENIRTEHKV